MNTFYFIKSIKCFLSVQKLIRNMIYKAGKKVSVPAEQGVRIETNNNQTLAFGNQYCNAITSRSPRSLQEDNDHFQNMISDPSSGSNPFYLYL